MNMFEGFVGGNVPQEMGPFYLSLTLILIAVGSALYIASNSKETKNPWQTVGGRRFLTGHLHLIDARGLADRFSQWAETYGGKVGCYQFFFLRKKAFVICNEERLVELAKYRPHKVQRSAKIREAVDSLGAIGLFSAEGDQWKREHKLVSATLNRNNVQDYMKTMKKMADRLVSKWSSNVGEEGTVLISNDLSNIAADSVSNISMAKDFNFTNSTKDAAGGAGHDIFEAMAGLTSRALSPVWYWRIPVIGQYLDKYGAPSIRIIKLISDVVARHEQQQQQTVETKSSEQTTTFLDKLYHLMKSENSPLDRQRVVGNIGTLFVAGTDTTAKTLMTSMYLLAVDQQLQKELREEADGLEISDDEMIPPLNEIHQKMPRLKSFLHEVHRYYGVPLIAVQASSDLPFAGGVLRKGDPVYVALRHISLYGAKNPQLGPNGEGPSEFCAQRFLTLSPETGSMTCPDPDTKGGAFLGFGFGVRKCPGRTYSEALSYLVLISILKKLEWELAPNHEKVKFHFNVTVSPACDIELKMKNRSI